MLLILIDLDWPPRWCNMSLAQQSIEALERWIWLWWLGFIQICHHQTISSIFRCAQLLWKLLSWPSWIIGVSVVVVILLRQIIVALVLLLRHHWILVWSSESLEFGGDWAIDESVIACWSASALTQLCQTTYESTVALFFIIKFSILYLFSKHDSFIFERYHIFFARRYLFL